MDKNILKQPVKALIGFVFTVLCFGSIVFLHQSVLMDGPVLLAAFGAAVVLAFNEQFDYHIAWIFVSSAICAFVGVACQEWVSHPYYDSILAIGISLATMFGTGIKYPPAGAITLIPTLGSEKVEALGYSFVLFPVLSGISIICIFSIIHKYLLERLINHGK